MTRFFRFFLTACFALIGGFGYAHELQPAYLELRETGPGTLSVLWKIPAREELRTGLRPKFPQDWKRTSDPIRFHTVDSDVERFTLSCASGIVGGRVSVEGSAASMADVLVRYVRSDGSTQVGRLTPAIQSFTIKAVLNRWQSALTYLRLGVEHILVGVDHVLFVLGLLFIVKGRWTLVKTITSFTVAHSVTLAIASLGYVSVPAPPLNAAIALSILFLGPEMMRARRGETSLTIRHPWAVAFVFGLLHGFGFASGLTALGLGRSEIPAALLCFNVGVEAGQLLFVGLIVLLEWSFRVLQIQWVRWIKFLPTYTVGTLGAYWTIQRTLVLLKEMR